MDDVDIQRLSRAQRDRGTVPERLLGLLGDGAFDVERELLAREPRVLDLERRRRVRGQTEQPEPAVGVGRRGRRPEARRPLRVIGLDLSRAGTFSLATRTTTPAAGWPWTSTSRPSTGCSGARTIDVSWFAASIVSSTIRRPRPGAAAMSLRWYSSRAGIAGNASVNRPWASAAVVPIRRLRGRPSMSLVCRLRSASTAMRAFGSGLLAGSRTRPVTVIRCSGGRAFGEVRAVCAVARRGLALPGLRGAPNEWYTALAARTATSNRDVAAGLSLWSSMVRRTSWARAAADAESAPPVA